MRIFEKKANSKKFKNH